MSKIAVFGASDKKHHYILKIDKFTQLKGEFLENKLDEFIENKLDEWANDWNFELIDIMETDDKFELDKTVKKYMLTYGIENVRGGSYNIPILTEWQLKALESELESLSPMIDVKITNKYEDYAEKFIDVKIIDETINAFTNRIIHQTSLINMIKDTSKYNMKFLSYYNNSKHVIDEVNTIIHTINENLRHKLNNLMKTEEYKIFHIVKKCSEDGWGFIDSVERLFVNKYCTNYTQILSANNILMELICINIETKKKLDEAVAIYDSIETNQEKITALLNRKIRLLSIAHEQHKCTTNDVIGLSKEQSNKDYISNRANIFYNDSSDDSDDTFDKL
jgi:hypothetical protein